MSTLHAKQAFTSQDIEELSHLFFEQRISKPSSTLQNEIEIAKKELAQTQETYNLSVQNLAYTSEMVQIVSNELAELMSVYNVFNSSQRLSDDIPATTDVQLLNKQIINARATLENATSLYGVAEENKVKAQKNYTEKKRIVVDYRIRIKKLQNESTRKHSDALLQTFHTQKLQTPFGKQASSTTPFDSSAKTQVSTVSNHSVISTTSTASSQADSNVHLALVQSVSTHPSSGEALSTSIILEAPPLHPFVAMPRPSAPPLDSSIPHTAPSLPSFVALPSSAAPLSSEPIPNDYQAPSTVYTVMRF